MIVINYNVVSSTQYIALKIAESINNFDINQENYNIYQILDFIISLHNTDNFHLENDNFIDISISKSFTSGNSLIIAVIAKEQNNGIGRLDRKWVSQEGNFFCTLIIKHNLLESKNIKISLLPYYIALSCFYAINNFITNASNTIKIKWPNDILVNHNKICGILIQSIKNTFLIGIGINIFNKPDITDTQIIYPATCLHDFCNINKNFLDKIISELLNLIITNFLSLIDNNFNEIKKIYISNSFKFNDIITIKTKDNNTITGIFKSISNTGEMQIINNNNTINISFGDVS